LLFIQYSQRENGETKVSPNVARERGHAIHLRAGVHYSNFMTGQKNWGQRKGPIVICFYTLKGCFNLRMKLNTQNFGHCGADEKLPTFKDQMLRMPAY